MRLSEERQETIGYIILWVMLLLALLGSIVGVAIEFLTIAYALGG